MAGTAKATTLLLFLAAIIFHAHQGDAQGCDLLDIHVHQAKTGNIVEEQPEYQVTISNNCACPQIQVHVRCIDLLWWVEPADENKLRVIDDHTQECLVANGGPIGSDSPVTFTYASEMPQDFPVMSARSQC